MRFSSLSGAGRGDGRHGRWFVLVFLCVALVLVVVPAVSLAWGSSPTVTLKASPTSVVAGQTVKFTASVTSCPAGATVTLQSKGSSGSWVNVNTAPVKSGVAMFKVAVMRNASYQAILKWSHSSVTSKAVCVKVTAKLTLCVKPAQYGGVAISGSLVPGWAGGKVTVTVAQIVHCNRLNVVATLTVPLTQGPGDSSVFATSWTNAHYGHGTFVITVKVAKTADFAGACASKMVKL